MKLASLHLRLRLALAFGIVVLLSLLSSMLALSKLGELSQDLDTVVETNNAKLDYSFTMAESVHIASRVIRTTALVAEHDKERARAEEVKLRAARTAYDKAEAELERLPPDSTGRQLRDAVAASKAHARPLNTRFVSLALEDQHDAAVKLLLEEAIPANQAWLEALDANMQHIKKGNRALEDAARTAFESGRRALMGLAVFNLVVAVVLTMLILRSLRRELGGEPAVVARIAHDIADARLDGHIQVAEGDHSSVMAAMARMQTALTQMARDLRSQAEQVASASEQIAMGNGDLSQRTEEQAASLQQTAATMDQLGAAVKHNADNARQANQLAVGAAAVAQRGGDVFDDLVDRMRGIHESSARIAEIISVIDGIAFQTNILALNAAVEAARAGEQGRGFAVVASEVRVLAQRSAAAAKEIKHLITHSVEQVQQGNERVELAHDSITDIVNAVVRLRDIVGEISSASTEQSSGLAQINGAVSQMDAVTQKNAALVEEGAAAAEGLRLQAERLLSTASVFRLGETASHEQTALAARNAAPARHRPGPSLPAKSSAPTARRAATATRTPARPAAQEADAAREADWAMF